MPRKSRIDALGWRKIAVKVVDIFGNDTMTIIEAGERFKKPGIFYKSHHNYSKFILTITAISPKYLTV